MVMVDILLTCSDVEPLQFCLYINFLSWFPSIKRFFHFLFLFLASFVVVVVFFIFDFFREKKERKKRNTPERDRVDPKSA